MIISDIKSQQVEDFQELSANVSAKSARNGDFRVWFRIPQEFEQFPMSADSFLVGFLISCMYVGEDLHIDAPVSKILLRRIPEIQSLITSWWYPDFQEISVTCTETNNSPSNANPQGRGCCFSGGVDSWYSLLKNQDEISHLILIRGMGGKDFKDEFWLSQKQSAEIIAQSFGKKLIPVTTNLRIQTDMSFIFKWSKYPWGKAYFDQSFYGIYSHGSLLAAVGLSLKNIVSELIIPSSYPYADLHPWGSHPLLDPLWSTEDVKFIHDGCEAARLEKLKNQVLKSDLALKTLKVCHKEHQDISSEYNCCKCEKCLRTMMQLRLCGVLEKASSFPHTSEMQNIKNMTIPKQLEYFYPPIIEEAKVIGDTELVDSIEIALGKKFSLERFYKMNLKPKLRNLHLLKSR